MIEVIIFARLSNAFIVLFGGTKYILSNDDILFSSSKTYTYPDKLKQEYHAR